jgi:PAS domain S-box-containing protein
MNSRPDSPLFRTILESLPVPVYVVDRERRILVWNSGAEKASGYLRHEVIGRACRDDLLIHCNEHGTVLCRDACPLAATMHDGRPRTAEVYMRHKKGHRVPVKVQSVVVRNDAGSIVGAAEVFEEISVMPGRVLDRPSLETLLDAQFVDYAERHIPFGILMIQFQGLPQVDRMFGRPAEHEMTTELIDTLARSIRRDDHVGWWSETRLLAILANCWPAAVAEIAATIGDLAAQTTVPWWGDRLNISVKVSRAEVRDDDSPESLVARCEEAIQCQSGAGNPAKCRKVFP